MGIADEIIKQKLALAQSDAQNNFQLQSPSLLDLLNEAIRSPPPQRIEPIAEGTSLGSFDTARAVQDNPLGNFFFGGAARNVVAQSKGEKPKYMRQKTYDRLRQQAKYYENKVSR